MIPKGGMRLGFAALRVLSSPTEMSYDEANKLVFSDKFLVIGKNIIRKVFGKEILQESG